MSHRVVFIPLALHEQPAPNRMRYRCVNCGDRWRLPPDRYDPCPALVVA